MSALCHGRLSRPLRRPRVEIVDVIKDVAAVFSERRAATLHAHFDERVRLEAKMERRFFGGQVGRTLPGPGRTYVGVLLDVNVVH